MRPCLSLGKGAFLLVDTSDGGAYSRQFLFEPLVAAVEMVDAVNDGRSLSSERGKN